MVSTTPVYTARVIQHIKDNGEMTILVRNPTTGRYCEADWQYGFESSSVGDQGQSLEWYARRVQLEAEYQRSKK